MFDGYASVVDYLKTVTRRICEKTSLTKQLHTYMLRYTHISFLDEAGVDLSYIMNRVSHKLSKLYYFFDTAFQKFIYKQNDFFRHFYFSYIFVISRILNAFLKLSKEFNIHNYEH